jgi:hypothetical protein
MRQLAELNKQNNNGIGPTPQGSIMSLMKSNGSTAENSLQS